MSFTHLHVHSHYSLLNGLPKIPDLVRAAKERGFSSLALTDCGAMYGVIEFYETCLKAGIKPILGFEAYVAPRTRFDKDPEKDGRAPSLVLLAENIEGYRHLMMLSSIGHLEGFFHKPRIDKEVLRQYTRGIIALSGSIDGEIPHLLKEGKATDAEQAARTYHDIFGQGNFYLELQDHPAIPGQMEVNMTLIALSKKTGIPLVVTRDVHYLNQEDAEAQDILRCVAEGWHRDETDREDYRQVDRSLNSEKEIASRFRHVKEALENTEHIAERVNIEIPLNQWHFAKVELKEGKTADELLRDMAYANVGKFYGSLTDEVKQRLDYELETIQKKGYAPYFLCVADFVRYAKTNGIVETTRGSAAGSVVSYVIGITTVDPIRFRLPFERFLTLHRPTPPDIDTDFADDRRDEMIAYVTKKYGEDKVAQIITFGTMAARASVRDVGRALGLSYSFCDQIAKLIPPGAQGFSMTIERALKEEPDLKKFYTSNADVKRLLDLAQKVEGCARHTSIHAAGVVIAPTPLTDFTPIQRETGGEKITTQYEMHAVESAGLLKMDFLGIRNLSILGKAVEIVQKTTGETVDIYALPLDDASTFDMLSRGETMGTFQLGGSGITRWLKELRPNTIDDIMAMVALYRPGPMEVIPEYIRRKHNPGSITYLDPRMKEYLQASFGLLVYQDDVLLTAIHLAGYDWLAADTFRKAIGKKIPEEMEKQKIKFFQGCRDYANLSEVTIEELWRQIEPFAAYGFNKCVVGSTNIVDTQTGKIRRIDEIVAEKKKMSILSLTDLFQLKKQRVADFHKNGKKRVYTLKTRTGRMITATNNHPFLLFQGWTRLDELKVGDFVAVPRKISYQSSKKINRKILRVLGYLISEGNLCHPNGAYFYSTKEEEITDFISCLSAFSNTGYTIDRKKKAIAVYAKKKKLKTPNGLFVALKNFDLLGKTATEIFVPDIIFQTSPKEIGIFLGALWQGDGCIHSQRDGQIYYTTSSERLAHDVQHLLLRLGMMSTIHKKKFRYRGDYKNGFTIHVSHRSNILLFKKWIGKHLLENKQKELDILIKNNRSTNGRVLPGSARGTTDIIPKTVLSLVRQEMALRHISIKKLCHDLSVAERFFHVDIRRKGYQRETIEKMSLYLKSKKLLALARSDVYWDEVVSIEDAGIEETYDITIPETHNFVANDVIVHNSHAASYGMVAYQTAYMKAHYPVQYMTAVLQAEAGDAEKVAAIAHECRRMEIDVLPPDVNESFRNFAMVSKTGEPGRIRFGLTAIKNVGEHICEVIYQERRAHGAYQSLEDFLSRIHDKDLNKKSLESLIQAGAMDSFGHDRGVLLGNCEHMLSYLREIKERTITKQDSLFSSMGLSILSSLTLRSAPAASLEQKLLWERSLLGLYVSSHPCAAFTQFFDGVTTPIADIDSRGRDQWVVIMGIVDSVKKKLTKKGGVMLVVSVQDESGGIEVLVFPKVYEQTATLWKEGVIVCIIGKTPSEDGDAKIFAEKVHVLSKDNIEDVARYLRGSTMKNGLEKQPSGTKSIHVRLSAEELKTHAEELKIFFAEHPGTYAVFVHVGDNVIRANAMVAWSEDMERHIISLLGTGKIITSREATY